MKDMLIYLPYIIIVIIIFGGLFIYVFNILIGIIVSIIFGLFLITLLVALESIL